MTWWSRIGSGEPATPVDRPRLRDRLRSVYEREPVVPDPDRPGRVEVVAGHRVFVPACCRDPKLCERPECWTRF